MRADVVMAVVGVVLIGCADNREREPRSGGRTSSLIGLTKDAGAGEPHKDAALGTSSLAAVEVTPGLVEIQPDQTMSFGQELDALLSYSQASAVFDIVQATAESDPSHEIVTKFNVSATLTLKGTAPAFFVLPGGTLGDTTISSAHRTQLEIGKSYLGFFRGGEIVLVAAISETNEIVSGNKSTLLSTFVSRNEGL